MHPQWARDLRDQCVAAGVPFLFKQWGEWGPGSVGNHTAPMECDGGPLWKVGKHAAGRLLDGRTWDEFPTIRGGQA
jgi:protein gp37